jgi:hypothetical protein
MQPLDDEMFAGADDFGDFGPPSEPEDAADDEGADGDDDRDGSPVPSDDF